MVTDHCPCRVHHVPRHKRLRPPLAHHPRVIAIRHKADFHGVRLVAVRQVVLRRDVAHRAFFQMPDRKHRPVQHRALHPEQHVRLILLRIHRAPQHVPPAALFHPRIMPRRDELRPDRVGILDHLAELQLVIAHHARIRRPPPRILRCEVINDLVKLFFEVQCIKRNAQHPRHEPRIPRVTRRAAPLPRPHFLPFVPLCLRAFVPFRGCLLPVACCLSPHPMPHKQPDHLVPLLHQQARGHTAVHPAAHRDHHLVPLGIHFRLF